MRWGNAHPCLSWRYSADQRKNIQEVRGKSRAIARSGQRNPTVKKTKFGKVAFKRQRNTLLTLPHHKPYTHALARRTYHCASITAATIPASACYVRISPVALAHRLRRGSARATAKRKDTAGRNARPKPLTCGDHLLKFTTNFVFSNM
jgi:hypothetical protein